MKTTSTALITGASSGIGAAFAKIVAARGYNLILVARRQDRLETLAAEIRQHYPIDVMVVPADLAQEKDIVRVEQIISEHSPIDMLVNNAGFGYHGPFVDIAIDTHMDMIHVHIAASVRLCYAVVSGMLTQNKGSIINVASIAAFLAPMGHITYAATKQYLVTFSEVLQMELAHTNIKVQALCPGFTRTEFHSTPAFAHVNFNDMPNQLWMTSEEVVEASLQALHKPKVVCIPGWRNRMIVALSHSQLKQVVKSVLVQLRSRTSRGTYGKQK